ncbi:winged helix DNA-binding domain-containing protein [Kineococcus sp. SYSU DK005]|uniref:winged helix DNA-binding domain-containing protein n=1 Tax=Kineococcus sp. SYSU DK005 TaxID=3383126 RepID=UPI003D7D9CC8
MAQALTVLHATDPATVYLSCWARMRERSHTVADLDRALYEDKTLVKQLAMRRTLFVAPRDLLAAMWPSAAARVARTEAQQMARDIEKAGVHHDGAGWLADARAEVLDVLAAAPTGLPATEIRAAVPRLQVKLDVAAGSSWTGSRVLTHLGATADIVRGHNTGTWRTSRPRWVRTQDWLGQAGAGAPSPLEPATGYRVLVHHWLRTFGPGTEDDIVWWLGSTKTVVRAALRDLDAVPVTLEGGGVGWLLPDDVDIVAAPQDTNEHHRDADIDADWVALLPVLDPTVMGWKHRDFYMSDHGAALFDRNGNAGTTVWVNGRIVGCWTLDPREGVRLHLLEEVPSWAIRRLQQEAEELSVFLTGATNAGIITSPAMTMASP